MNARKRFGKYVLLAETGRCGLGVEHRAAQLGNTGLERIVTLLRLHDSLAAKTDLITALTRRVRGIMRMRHPGVVRTLATGSVDGACFVAHELVNGRTLKDVLNRCREQNATLPSRHALLIMSAACSALEHAHSCSYEGGDRVFHGLLTPANVVVSYDGDVRLRGFGYWNVHLRDSVGLDEDELPYIAPEQRVSGQATARADVYSIGALLLNAVMGRAPWQGMTSREIDIPSAALAEILRDALDLDPDRRQAEMAALRKALDKILFTGDVSATRHDLGRFLREVFRDDIGRESRALKAERSADYFGFLLDVQTALSTAGRVAIKSRRETPPPALPSIPTTAAAAKAATKPPEIVKSGQTTPSADRSVSEMTPTYAPPGTAIISETPSEPTTSHEATKETTVESAPEPTQFELLPPAPEVAPPPPRSPTPIPPEVTSASKTPSEPTASHEATRVESTPAPTQFEPLPPAPEVAQAPPRSPTPVPPMMASAGETPSEPTAPYEATRVESTPAPTQFEPLPPAPEIVTAPTPTPTPVPPATMAVSETPPEPAASQIADASKTQPETQTAETVPPIKAPPAREIETAKTAGAPPIEAPSAEKQTVSEAKETPIARPSAVEKPPQPADRATFGAPIPRAAIAERRPSIRPPKDGVMIFAAKGRSPKRPSAIILILAALVLLAGIVSAVLVLRSRPTPTAPPTTTLSPEQIEAERRVLELEEQRRALLRQLEEDDEARAESGMQGNREPRPRSSRPTPSQ